MHKVFAEQELQMWGEDDRKEVWEHEVAVYGEQQSFRKINADGSRGREMGTLPYPKVGARPSNEWVTLLRGIAAPDTPLKYLGHGAYQGRSVYLYNYEALAKAKVCNFAERIDHTISTSDWLGYVDCAGTVIADEQFNPLEITRELYPPSERATWLFRLAVDYNFVDISGSATPLLVPMVLRLACQFKNGEWHFASATWKNYHEFRVQSTIRLAEVH
jgi:hypothetical protein